MKKASSTHGDVLHGGAVRLPLQTISPDETDVRNVSCSYYTVSVGGQVTSHYHTIKTEIWLIVSGTGVVRLGDELMDVTAGTAIITPPNTVHGLPKVFGDAPIVFANFASPANPAGPNRYAGTVEVAELIGE